MAKIITNDGNVIHSLESFMNEIHIHPCRLAELIHSMEIDESTDSLYISISFPGPTGIINENSLDELCRIFDPDLTYLKNKRPNGKDSISVFFIENDKQKTANVSTIYHFFLNDDQKRQIAEYVKNSEIMK